MADPDFIISTDKTKLDFEVIEAFLSERSYWAQGRTPAAIRKSVENSLCFGVYNPEGKQAGFARVITDYVVFAWVLDVFILEEYRGNGLGKMLIKTITEFPELRGVKKWGLGTKDAHGFYKQFGFTAPEKPENLMERIMLVPDFNIGQNEEAIC